jgi:hypothetical protein
MGQRIEKFPLSNFRTNPNFNAVFLRLVSQIKITFLLKIQLKQHHILYVISLDNIVLTLGISAKLSIKFWKKIFVENNQDLTIYLGLCLIYFMLGFFSETNG